MYMGELERSFKIEVIGISQLAAEAVAGELCRALQQDVILVDWTDGTTIATFEVTP
jgi:hypothetical protein